MTTNSVQVGTAGLTVSRMGLGCMGMSGTYGPTDWDQSTQTIRRALDLGITLLDTADVYGQGHNEVLVGRAIDGRRSEVQLGTKFGIDRTAGRHNQLFRGHPDYVRASCEASLRRLGVEEIDIYYCHRPPEDVPIEDTIGAMASLVQQGKVRTLGVCELNAEQLRRAHAVHPIAVMQSELSIWTRDVEAVTSTMRELGVALVAFSPLGRGFLTGTVNVDSLDPSDFRSRNDRFLGAAGEANQAIAETVRQVAAEAGVTPAQVALAWVYAQSPRFGVPLVTIPGTRNPNRLQENLDALDLSLSLSQPTLSALERLGSLVQGERYGLQ